MANEIIKPHKFEVAKNNIHSLSKTVPNVSLQKFPTKGSIFSWNDHNITGNEANSLLVSPLQSTLIAQNTTIRSLFNIADEVYNALESLDKEYIQGIIAAVKSAEIASDQAKTASDKANTASSQALEASRKALDASTKATTAQADIKRTIEALQTTVRILKEFKEKVTKDLSSIASLNTKITSVNSKIQTVENRISDIAPLNTRITSVNSKIQSIENKINDIAGSAKDIKDIRPYFSSLTHIKDIDQIWTDLKNSREVVKGLIDTLSPFMSRVNQTTSRIDADINALKQYRTLLETYQHLGDVDAIWSDVEGHKTNLASFHEQVDTFVEKVNQATSRIDADIDALKQYRTLLETYQHLGDVDAIWSDVEGHKTDLSGLHDKLNTFIKETHSEQEKIEKLIRQMEDDNNLVRLQYNKKLKIAYWVGGSAVGLTVINYILQIIGIL